MAATGGVDAVEADGNADGIFAVGIGIDNFPFCHASRAVHSEHHAVHWHVGAGIIDDAAHLETGDVGEVVVVERHGTGADEAVARLRRELMDTQFGLYGVARSAAGEGDAADDILAALVGHAVNPQLRGGGDDIAELRGAAHGGMVAVGNAARA